MVFLILQSQLKSASLTVAAVTLAWFGNRLRVPATVLGERLADIIALGKAAVIVAADISLVAPGVNQFTLVSFALRGSQCGYLHGNFMQ